MHRRLKSLIILLGMTSWALSALAVREVTLEWDRSADPTVVGYKVYWRDIAGTTTNVLDVRNTNSCIVTGLIETKTYSFYLTSYNSAGLESDPSNEVIFTVPLPSLLPRLARDSKGAPVMTLHLDAVSGQRMVLQTSTNLVDWTTVTTSALGEALNYQAASASTEPKRFYRTIIQPTLPALMPRLSRTAQGKPVMTFHMDLVAGKSLALQTSTDMHSWSNLVVSAVGQPLDCQVTNQTSEVKRFYRSVSLP